MKPIWAIDPSGYETFLAELSLKLKALKGLTAKQLAGPIEDAKRGGLPISRDGGTAIIRLGGPMMKNPGWLRFFGFASTRDVQLALKSALADETVDRIVLSIDSPGGEVDGTAELADAVADAAKHKHVIAQVDGMAASAAYWVASQASAIYAGRMDMIGSIGVRMLVYDFSDMFEQAGIRAIPIDTGEFKSTGAQGTEITEEQQSYLQGLVDASFNEFKSAVQAGRGLSDDQFNAVGDGRVFPATDAINLGLIDQIQTMDGTMSNFRQQASRKARLAFIRQ